MPKSWREEHSLKDDRTLPIFIHSIIDDMTQLPPNAMRVYMHLVRRADKSGVAWPSYQGIADHCFASISDNPSTRKSYARKAIDQLIAAGLVRKELRAREDGGQTSNAYVLVDPCLISTPMLNKHPHAYSAAPVPIEQGPCLSSTKDIPYEDSPLKEKDGLSLIWAHCLEELSPTLPAVAAARLAGSQLEIVDETHFSVILAPHVTDGLDWLNRQAKGVIGRTLSVTFHKRIEVEIIAATLELENAQ